MDKKSKTKEKVVCLNMCYKKESVINVKYEEIKNLLTPLSIVLFCGSDWVSKIITGISAEQMSDKEEKQFGVWTHVGILVNKEVMPFLPNIQNIEWGCLEMTCSGKLAGDPTPDLVTGKGKFGVQVRDLVGLLQTYPGKIAILPLSFVPYQISDNQKIHSFSTTNTSSFEEEWTYLEKRLSRSKDKNTKSIDPNNNNNNNINQKSKKTESLEEIFKTPSEYTSKTESQNTTESNKTETEKVEKSGSLDKSSSSKNVSFEKHQQESKNSSIEKKKAFDENQKKLKDIGCLFDKKEGDSENFQIIVFQNEKNNMESNRENIPIDQKNIQSKSPSSIEELLNVRNQIPSIHLLSKHELVEHLSSIWDRYKDIYYQLNILRIIASAVPKLRFIRKFFSKKSSWKMCSDFAASVYQDLGYLPKQMNTENVIPTDFIIDADQEINPHLFLPYLLIIK